MNIKNTYYSITGREVAMRSSKFTIFLLGFFFLGVSSLYAQTDLEVNKSVSDLQPLVGNTITYSVVVTNNGPDDATAIGITDMVPAGLVYVTGSSSDALYDPGAADYVWDIASLLIGESQTLTFDVVVKASVLIVNCAAVTASTPADSDATNNEGCATIAPQDQTTFWQNTNLNAGTVTGFAFSTSLPKTGAVGTLFASTDLNGVYRSLSNGDDWFPTGLTNVYARAIAVSSMNQSLWVGTFGAGAHRSDNLGDSYTNPFTLVGGQSDYAISLAINTFSPVSAIDGDIFIGTDGDGIFYTDDEGATWDDITGNLATDANEIIRSVIIEENGGGANDRIWVGTHGDGVWYTDYPIGAPPTWTDASGGGTLDLEVIHALAVTSGGELYAGTNSGIYHSIDDGVTWTHVVPDVVARTLLVYTCGATEYVMAGTAGDYVFRADTTVPLTWTQFDGQVDPPDGTVSGFQSPSVLALYYESTNEYLYAGTENKGVHRSEDCGELWEQVSNLSLQDGYRVIQSLVFDDANDRLYGGTFGFGVIMSPDFGEPVLSWTRVNNQLTNPWIFSMAYAQHGTKDYVYAGTWGDGVFRTLDGGERWVFMGLANRIIYDMAFSSTGVLFAATDHGEMSRSVDYGLTWQEIGVAQTAIWSIGIDPVDPDTIYAGSFGRGIFKSNDGGGTWAQTGMATGYAFDFAFGPHPETAVNGLFAAMADGVKFSSDGGVTWSDLSTGLSVIDTRAVAFANDGVSDILLAGTWGGGVFLYDPLSHSWIRDGMPSAEITTFAVSPYDGEVFVAASGKGLYRRSFASTVTGIEDRYVKEVPDVFALEQNYPNPFNPQTTIQFSLPEVSEVRLVVYDVLGRQVRMLVQGVLSHGTHQHTFDAADLANGMYFYQLESAGQTLTKTMILLK